MDSSSAVGTGDSGVVDEENEVSLGDKLHGLSVWWLSDASAVIFPLQHSSSTFMSTVFHYTPNCDQAFHRSRDQQGARDNTGM